MLLYGPTSTLRHQIAFQRAQLPCHVIFYIRKFDRRAVVLAPIIKHYFIFAYN